MIKWAILDGKLLVCWKTCRWTEGVGSLVTIVGFSVWISRLFMFKLSFYSKWHLTERTVVGFYHDLAASFFVKKTFCPGCRWWNSSWGEGPALAFHCFISWLSFWNQVYIASLNHPLSWSWCPGSLNQSGNKSLGPQNQCIQLYLPRTRVGITCVPLRRLI